MASTRTEHTTNQVAFSWREEGIEENLTIRYTGYGELLFTGWGRSHVPSHPRSFTGFMTDLDKDQCRELVKFLVHHYRYTVRELLESEDDI
jgi:hypothetical protein